MRGAPAAALLLATAVLLSGCVAPWEEVETGLDPETFAVPEMGVANASLDPLPTERTSYEPMPRPTFQLYWSMSTVFIDGGFLSARITNTGSGDIWVYGLTYAWSAPYSESSSKDVSVRVPPGGTGELGLLAIPPHEATGYKSYTVGVTMLAWNDWFHQSGWYDCGFLDTELQEAFVEPLGQPSAYDVMEASFDYHNRWNSLLEADAPWVTEIADNLTGGAEFTLESALDAFDWVTAHVEYMRDPGTGDEWSSSGETIDSGVGDCEDQAILVSAIVTAMGGVARGYLIEGHAFAGVHIGNVTAEADVGALVQEHYGSALPARFIRDSGRSFLVLDPAGSLYAGGLPTGAALTPGGWDFNETSVLIVVEVTGQVLERTLGQAVWGVTCGSAVFILMAVGVGVAFAVGLIVFSFVSERWIKGKKA